MPDVVVLFKSHPEIEAGIEKGVNRLLVRCPWMRQERWSIDKLMVYALGNKYEFPRYAQDSNGRSIILSGDIRLDDIEERAGGKEGFHYFTGDTLFNSLFN